MLSGCAIADGLVPARYVASQGTAMVRAGRVSSEQAGEDIWGGTLRVDAP
ncbi:hypothetical protein [Pseudomonas sp. D1HM]